MNHLSRCIDFIDLYCAPFKILFGHEFPAVQRSTDQSHSRLTVSPQLVSAEKRKEEGKSQCGFMLKLCAVSFMRDVQWRSQIIEGNRSPVLIPHPKTNAINNTLARSIFLPRSRLGGTHLEGDGVSSAVSEKLDIIWSEQKPSAVSGRSEWDYLDISCPEAHFNWFVLSSALEKLGCRDPSCVTKLYVSSISKVWLRNGLLVWNKILF